ncbi:MAG: hypothetical protein JWN48_3859 [Myxococcaceae bacterium]|nr:hypothetical protein [Myxococcaceae bacterium]
MVIKIRAMLYALACLLYGSSGHAQASSTGHALLLIRADAGTYAVVGRRDLPDALPRALPRAAHQGWSFQALDAAGAVIHTGALPNPQIVRGEFKDPHTGETSGVHMSDGSAVTFSIRVPSNAKTVVLYSVSIPTTPAAPSVGTRSKALSNSAVLARIAL